MYDGFSIEQLDDSNVFHRGRLPETVLAALQFEALWSIHPDEFHEIMIHGKLVKTPRWQQAFGKDYHYTSRTNVALPTPRILQPLVDWGQAAIDCRLNGVLVNWYDGKNGHYIGRHRDSVVDMIGGAPIVTISLGEERVFRLRPWKGRRIMDFSAGNGSVFVMPYETNLRWTHEVPRRARDLGQRISVTLRAFV